ASADSFVLQEGLLDSRQDTPRTLTLAADAGLASGRELVVTLGCQAPDLQAGLSPPGRDGRPACTRRSASLPFAHSP
ncbi:DUF2195 family protein, partial [Listeria monocytogenes]|nr:DUF2195 family protein [Listeria monocytogenes]